MDSAEPPIDAPSPLPRIEPLTLEANGMTFSALATGDESDNRGVVLIMHGFPDSAHSFGHQAQALAAAGYRVVVPTMRGYQQSSQPADNDYRLESLVSDVVGWLDHLGVTTAHLVGHDWGAAVAYLAGARNPDRFETITAMAVPPLSGIPAAIPRVPRQLLRSWYMTWFQVPALAEKSVSVSERRLIRQLWRTWSPGLSLPESDWDHLRAIFDTPGVVNASLAYYRQNATPLILAGLRKVPATQERVVAVPTLIINGADDGCMDPRLFTHAIIDDDFPAGLTHVELANVGHFLHLEQPERITQLMLDHFS